MTQQEVAAIPEDGILLHVGVHKSGTTSLQEALRRRKRKLSDNSVIYQGPVLAGWGRLSADFDPQPSDDDAGNALLRRISEHPGRVIISSEFLCTATFEQAAHWLQLLPTGRPVTVMVTVRSLADLLPSSWQETVKGPTTRYGGKTFETWLREVFADSGHARNAFWKRNNYPRILKRWGRAAGQSNVIFVVADKSDKERLHRVTERLLALPDGLLPQMPRSNQSISYQEAELFRRVKLSAGEGYSTPEILAVRKGMRAATRQQDLSGDRIPVPQWAADEVGPIAEEFARALLASQASIVGRIEDIALPGTPPAAHDEPPESVDLRLAAAAALGALRELRETESQE